ncbi:Zn-dependent protease [Rubidibacter lacunae KORDI 51-2]|uniref:Zinc metalloprotease n=1 Tax=Rubidibacter lacunae KORDI 51-2 TaxID=582515 RepID=U5DKG4_9CHRO|nr:site-2 protease family protein [Rubidibacter lacunae]ERN41059.1 Zn-dependent protease [Rubidibacter lacunae KORDI 51-2]
MGANWRIGTLFGIPLYVNASWFLILAFVTFANAANANAKGWVTESNPLLGWAIGFAIALLLFGSVLLHELGHSLVAKAQGIPVQSITLFLFGGIATIDRESETPGKAFQVAIAGPVVSLSLGGMFFALALASNATALQPFVLDLARINLVLGLFNLIPGMPLDGGQVLKAALWKLTGDRLRAARWAAASGQTLGLLAIALGLFASLVGGSFATLWIAAIGWFVFQNAGRYQRVTALQEILLQIAAADTMTRKLRVLDATQTLREFADTVILDDKLQSRPLYAASDGRYRGAIVVSDLQAIARADWEHLTLADIARPLESVPSIAEKATLADVVLALDATTDPHITVLSPAGTLAGTIDRGDVVRAIADAGGWSASPEDIARIQAERAFPPTLKLVALARATCDIAARSE